jgi:hypothetical protein
MSDGYFWSAKLVEGRIVFFRGPVSVNGAAFYHDKPDMLKYLVLDDSGVHEVFQDQKDAINAAEAAEAQAIAEAEAEAAAEAAAEALIPPPDPLEPYTATIQAFSALWASLQIGPTPTDWAEAMTMLAAQPAETQIKLLAYRVALTPVWDELLERMARQCVEQSSKLKP